MILCLYTCMWCEDSKLTIANHGSKINYTIKNHNNLPPPGYQIPLGLVPSAFCGLPYALQFVDWFRPPLPQNGIERIYTQI